MPGKESEDSSCGYVMLTDAVKYGSLCASFI
jgi:hypothetical protein